MEESDIQTLAREYRDKGYKYFTDAFYHSFSKEMPSLKGNKDIAFLRREKEKGQYAIYSLESGAIVSLDDFHNHGQPTHFNNITDVVMELFPKALSGNPTGPEVIRLVRQGGVASEKYQVCYRT